MINIEEAKEKYPTIPHTTLEALYRYLEHRLLPGGFLTSVLENNLSEAIRRADNFNAIALKDIVSLIYWEVPGNSWGSKENVRDWIEEKQK